MDLLTLLIVLLVVGVIMWFVNTRLVIDSGLKQILNFVVAVIAVIIVIWLLLRVMGIALPNLSV